MLIRSIQSIDSRFSRFPRQTVRVRDAYTPGRKGKGKSSRLSNV